MKYLLLFFCALGYCLDDSDLVVTRDYVDYLRKRVNWTVEDYENNVFRGWTIGEAKTLLGYLGIDSTFEDVPEITYKYSLPAGINWAGSNCDHDVKNQGSCGACWAFAVANMLSDRCCLEAKEQGWLSVQELISCDNESFGCYGGSLGAPVRYVQRTGGLVHDDCYPYAKKKEDCPNKCRDGKDWKGSHVCNCTEVAKCSKTAGIKKCLTSGPTPIGFSVCQSFMSYSNGTYSCDCDEYIGKHATLAMGYSDKPECHYHVKNSWGTSWGMDGYFNMACETCEISGGQVCTKIGK